MSTSTALENLTKKARAAGLDGLSAAELDYLIAAIASHIERQQIPRINPDRRYRVEELEPYGFKKGQFYKAHRHLICKDGRMSFVPGAAVLELVHKAPKLDPAAEPVEGKMVAPKRGRGRPRKTPPVENGLFVNSIHDRSSDVTGTVQSSA
ncbi:MAG: hypothetical protein JO008_11590 [Alphaproteobacteria bacterium]|nr:hypothetical protein [Alphaproteobacteria bacterium]